MYGTYRHYGSSEFNLDIFDPITNRDLWIKPTGGLWAEPIKPKTEGWKAWCEANEFRCDKLSEWFDFDLSNDAKVFRITNEDDIYRLSHIGCCSVTTNKGSKIFDLEVRRINFELLMSLGYDAVELEINDFTYWAMYGWDCDSIIVMNPDKIKPRIDEDISF